jgi:hypothetical protein
MKLNSVQRYWSDEGGSASRNQLDLIRVAILLQVRAPRMSAVSLIPAQVYFFSTGECVVPFQVIK